ncbi:hypothetical protein JW905_15920 [bacterium]|nr:hypothetical protein [candidate division CSSED10-310 bacterium]
MKPAGWICLFVMLLFWSLSARAATDMTRDWTRKVAMPTARSHLGVTAVGGKLVAVGGETAPYIVTGVTEQYSLLGDSWSGGTAKPHAAGDCAVAMMDDLVYCVSGFDGYGLIQYMDIYNTNLDTWSSQPLPEEIGGIIGAGLVAADGALYLLGGGDTYLNGRRNCFRWRPGEGWTPLADMNLGRLWFWAGTSPGRIYVTGGYSTSNPDRIMDSVEMYDMYLDQWFHLPEMPAPRMAMTGIVYGSELYLFGGTEDGALPVGDGFKLNPLWGAMPQWERIAGLPYPARMYAGGGAGLIGGDVALTVVGGYAESAARYEALNIVDQWILGPVPPTPQPTEPPTRTPSPLPSSTPTATPTYGATFTPTETPEPSATPGITPSATVYPITVDIFTNQDRFRPGDQFLLATEITNHGRSHFVDEYIVLDVYGTYFFWEDWTQEIDCKDRSIKSGGFYQEEILAFEWPAGAGSADGLAFYMVLTDYNTFDLMSNVDFCMFGYGE